MKANRRLLLVAVIFGLLTVFFLNYYLQTLTSGEAQARAAVARTEVVVVKNTIPAHTRITAEMVVLEPLPVDVVHPESIKNMEEAVGSISCSEIIAGEQLLAARISTGGQAGFAYRIPEKQRAVSLPVNEVTGVSGFIAPGDKVDVLVTYADPEINDGATITYTVIQNALVMAAGAATRVSKQEEQQAVNAVTLAVTPGQAEVLAYALQKGSFYFALRSPVDEETVKLDYYGANNLATFKER